MDAYKLTTKSQEALSDAVRRAATAGHPHVEPVHLLLALLAQSDGTAGALLEAAKADRARIRQQAEALFNRLPSATGATVAAPGLARPAFARAEPGAGDLAKELGDEYVSTEHLHGRPGPERRHGRRAAADLRRHAGGPARRLPRGPRRGAG